MQYSGPAINGVRREPLVDSTPAIVLASPDSGTSVHDRAGNHLSRTGQCGDVCCLRAPDHRRGTPQLSGRAGYVTHERPHTWVSHSRYPVLRLWSVWPPVLLYCLHRALILLPLNGYSPVSKNSRRASRIDTIVVPVVSLFGQSRETNLVQHLRQICDFAQRCLVIPSRSASPGQACPRTVAAP